MDIEQKWRPNSRPQDVRVGKYFLLSDFLYSEEAILKGVPNCPVDYNGFEVNGIKGLCAAILDPVVNQFGPLSVTFAYCSPELWRHWYGANANLTALHTFRPPQGGTGGAADIVIHSHPEDPRPVLNWIRQNCVYDRLIIYPGSCILCVAWTEVSPRGDCKEWVFVEGSKPQYLNAGWDRPAVPKNKIGNVRQGTLFSLLILATIISLTVSVSVDIA